MTDSDEGAFELRGRTQFEHFVFIEGTGFPENEPEMPVRGADLRGELKGIAQHDPESLCPRLFRHHTHLVAG
jgi:hypothetical protein